jgi:nucleoid-associated protein YgaU
LFLITGLKRTLTEGDRDVGVAITLKEYKYITLAEPDVVASQSAGGLYSRADERTIPAVYRTRGGEDLWTIARLCLGDGSRWRELAIINKIADPHNLPAGRELYLP